jgi:anti-anti-sigma regulatory factor
MAAGAIMKSEAVNALRWTILPFHGCSDSRGRRALRRNLLNAVRSSGSGIVVNFSGCDGLNHEDIRLMLDCLAYIAGRDIEILFVAGSPVIRVLLDVTRVSSLVPVFDSVDDALAHRQSSRASTVVDFPLSQSQSNERGV